MGGRLVPKGITCGHLHLPAASRANPGRLPGNRVLAFAVCTSPDFGRDFVGDTRAHVRRCANNHVTQLVAVEATSGFDLDVESAVSATRE